MTQFDSRLEDPINEMATLQHLSQPGHANVVSLIECMQDSEHVYAVMPFIAKVRSSYLPSQDRRGTSSTPTHPDVIT